MWCQQILGVLYRGWVSTIKGPGFALAAIPPVSGVRYSSTDPWLVAWEQDTSDQTWSLYHNFFWRITRGEMPFIRGCVRVCVQSLSCVRLFNPMDCSTVRLACPSLPLGVCSNLCPLSWWCYLTISFSAAPPDSPHLLLSSIFPSVRIFSNESAHLIRWPKYGSFSFGISPSNEYSGLISFRTDWFDLLAVQWTLKSLLQRHSWKASVLWRSTFFVV